MLNSAATTIKKRFNGYLPVVVDVETGGLNCQTDALLEIAAVTLDMNSANQLQVQETFSTHVIPFEGSRLEPEALAINKIDPFHPFRFAVAENEALNYIFEPIFKLLKATECSRAVLVGHNPSFDLGFIQAARDRCKIKDSPFHAFTCFDTATLGGLVYGQTVLARALRAAKIEFNKDEAHSAVYDAQKTAALFCQIVNQWHQWQVASKSLS